MTKYLHSDSGKVGHYTSPYKHIRDNRDKNYHNTDINRKNLNFAYNEKRQKWQDCVIKRVTTRSSPGSIEHPWIIYTSGVMGGGKGYLLSLLSQKDILPIETTVHIDPDYFKTSMPEWNELVEHGKKLKDGTIAGNMTHAESAYMQEIAEIVALNQRQNIIIDGSLSDKGWFESVFKKLRKYYPHYKIGIISIECDESIVLQRALHREREEGRAVDLSQIRKTLKQCPEAVG